MKQCWPLNLFDYSRFKHHIEFRDLRQRINTFSTGSLKPGAMCAASASTLLFEDDSKIPRDVYWLGCSGTEPRLTGKKVRTEVNYIWDMCYVPDDRRPLLINTDGDNVLAYNTVNNNLDWSSEVRGRSVATDGSKYVLVRSRYDNDIKMLSLSDGNDLGCLIREGDQGLGMLSRVR